MFIIEQLVTLSSQISSNSTMHVHVDVIDINYDSIHSQTSAMKQLLTQRTSFSHNDFYTYSQPYNNYEDSY